MSAKLDNEWRRDSRSKRARVCVRACVRRVVLSKQKIPIAMRSAKPFRDEPPGCVPGHPALRWNIGKSLREGKSSEETAALLGTWQPQPLPPVQPLRSSRLPHVLSGSAT